MTSIEAVFGEHYASLVRTAFLITRDGAEAEDLVQDAFAHMVPRWSAAEGTIVEPAAYLRKVMLRRYLRRRPRWRDVAARVPRESGWDSLENASIERNDLWSALCLLPPRQRTALVLRYYHDLETGEIAEQIGCRPSTARSLVHRGLSALKQSMLETPQDVVRRTS